MDEYLEKNGKVIKAPNCQIEIDELSNADLICIARSHFMDNAWRSQAINTELMCRILVEIKGLPLT